MTLLPIRLPLHDVTIILLSLHEDTTVTILCRYMTLAQLPFLNEVTDDTIVTVVFY